MTLKRGYKHTPVLDAIDQEKIDSIVYYLETCKEAKYFPTLGLVPKKSLIYIAEELLISWEDYEDMRETDQCLKVKGAQQCLQTISSNLYDKMMGKREAAKNKLTNIKRSARGKKERRVDNGYVRLLRPEHPRARRGYVGEHILIAEEKIGRPLKDCEIVHHIDHNRSNNSPDNLAVMRKKRHGGLEARSIKAMWDNGDLIFEDNLYKVKR